MDWKDIPSLSALRAFEAAARIGSYSAAARELNVTHAAIAQHVRALEDRFGQKLMERSGRGVAATAAGKSLAQDLNAGFSEIAAGVRALDEARSVGPLSVSTTRTFAENWLMPRLPSFWAAHPEIPLAISTDDNLVDLRRDGFHMAIRYLPECCTDEANAWFLTAGRKVVVGDPCFGAQIDPEGALTDELARLPWIMDPNYTDYLVWLEKTVAPVDQLTATYINGNPLILSALRAGAGLAMMPRAIVNDDIEAGRLQVFLDQGANHAGYFVITPEGPKSERVKVLERWLHEQAL